MSGPNDSATGVTLTEHLTFPFFDAAAPLAISPRFRLDVNWRTPHLEWLPTSAPTIASQVGSLWPELDDPEAAVAALARYIRDGSFLFDLSLPNWDALDRVFLAAPTVPTALLPTFAEMSLSQQGAFFNSLSAPPSPLGPRLAPSPLLSPLLLAPLPPLSFFKQPDAVVTNGEPTRSRLAEVSDVVQAFDALRPVQELKNRVVDRARLILPQFEREWDSWTLGEAIPAVSLSIALAGGVVGGILGAAPARRLAFQQLQGMKLPVPFLPGVEFSIDGFGKLDRYLIGAPSDPKLPEEFRFSVSVDLVEAVPALAKMLK